MAVEASSMISDYIFFIIFITLSTIYPIWNDMRTKKEAASKDNYVFAKGRVSIFAVMLSIARGMAGVQAFVGYPSEMFYRGSGMWETLYGLLSAYLIVCFVFVPVFCSLDITSIYQYLQLRFQSRWVRWIASGTFIIRHLFALGITIYIPCVVLNTVVGLSYVISAVGIISLVIVFTLLGGLKAAITADVIQGVLMIIVSLGFVIQGVYDAGGVSKVIEINNDNGRLKFFWATGDVTTRVDTPSAWIGQLFMSVSVMGTHQNLAQRYLSMKSVKEVRSILLRNMPFITVLFSLSWLVGMVIYATYFICDPMASGYTAKMDAILPFYVEDKLSYIPLVLGLFMACLFNGALCLAVSNINSVATVTWEDFLYHIPAFQKAADIKQLYAIKALGVTYCIITMGFVAAVAMMSGVIECANLTTSATAGPLVGVFILALLIPIANAKGAITGMIISHCVTLTLLVGNRIYLLPPTDLLPTTIEGCTNTTFSPWIEKNEVTWIDGQSPINNMAFVKTERSMIEIIFNITYMYYGFIGAVVCVVVGVIVSVFTRSKADDFDHRLLHPVIVKIWHYFGAPEGLHDEEDDETCRHDPARRPTFTILNTTPRLSISEQLPKPLQLAYFKPPPKPVKPAEVKRRDTIF